MKIAPIAAPSNTQGQAVDVGNGQGNSPDALARAKAAFQGVTQTPSTSYEDPVVTKTRESIRSLKMNTNASPDRFDDQGAFAQDNTITDPSRNTNATTEVTQPLSPQYAALAKQRRALQVKERELAERERSMSSQTPRTGADDVIARLKSQPLSVLQEHGVTYDQLTEAILSTQNSNPEMQALRDEIRALKEGVDKNFTERDSYAEQQVLSEMRKEAIELSKQGDTFEMVRETRSLPDVMRLIEQTYRTTGEVLDVQEAMQLVEDELMNESLKIANIKKVLGRLNSAPTQPAAQQQQTNPPMRTLTNRDTASPRVSAKARAIAAFYGSKVK